MNAIKAGKTEFTVNSKTYKVTGDTKDEKEAVANLAEETGKEMLKIFRGMHHDAGMNKDMDRYIQSHDWKLGNFTPDMFPSEEEFFDYDDPFDRIIDIDYSHRVNLSAPIIVGPQFSDGKYSVIDGNHRAAAAQRMGKTIKGYFPVEQVTEEEMKISDLTVSNAGMAIAQSAGGGSKTVKPVTVTKLPSGHIYLVNGYHRLVDAIKTGKDSIEVEFVPFEKVEILWKNEREEDIEYGKQFNIEETSMIFARKKSKGGGIKQVPDEVAELAENFADGKNPGRKGLAKRMGVNTKASVSSLRKTAKNSSGEKQRMAHWLANMKAGREK
jgi:hypothetical protein